MSCTASQEYSEVHWMLNNSRYNYFHTDDIEIDSRRTIAYIFISNITQEYNNTAIRCEGSYTNGQSFSSDEVIILLQGMVALLLYIHTSVLYNNTPIFEHVYSSS